MENHSPHGYEKERRLYHRLLIILLWRKSNFLYQILQLFMKNILFSIILIFGVKAQSQDLNNTFHSFDGTKIAYTKEGSGDAVLLIHGFISDGSSWNNTVVKKELLENGYMVIVPDLRGNGDSAKPHEAEAYAHDAEVKDLKALVKHLNLKVYKAIGYSRGSIVLTKLLSEETRIDKAVLGGMGLDFTNPDWDRRIMFQKAFSGEEPLNSVTSGAVNYANSIGADLKTLSLLQEFQPVTSIDQLHHIKAKVLVIAGDQDTDNGSPHDLQKEIPGAILKIIHGDHNNSYKSVEFSKEIIRFLN